jgi:cytochrome c
LISLYRLFFPLFRPAGETMKSLFTASLFAVAAVVSMPSQAMDELHKKHACTACHAVDKKLVGPAYQDVAKKYANDKDAVKKLSEKVRKGGSGVWGQIPMAPAASSVSDDDIKKMVESILAMNKK